MLLCEYVLVATFLCVCFCGAVQLCRKQLQQVIPKLFSYAFNTGIARDSANGLRECQAYCSDLRRFVAANLFDLFGRHLCIVHI
jgi:hypothetical protein